MTFERPPGGGCFAAAAKQHCARPPTSPLLSSSPHLFLLRPPFSASLLPLPDSACFSHHHPPRLSLGLFFASSPPPLPRLHRLSLLSFALSLPMLGGARFLFRLFFFSLSLSPLASSRPLLFFYFQGGGGKELAAASRPGVGHRLGGWLAGGVGVGGQGVWWGSVGHSCSDRAPCGSPRLSAGDGGAHWPPPWARKGSGGGSSAVAARPAACRRRRRGSSRRISPCRSSFSPSLLGRVLYFRIRLITLKRATACPGPALRRHSQRHGRVVCCHTPAAARATRPPRRELACRELAGACGGGGRGWKLGGAS